MRESETMPDYLAALEKCSWLSHIRAGPWPLVTMSLSYHAVGCRISVQVRSLQTHILCPGIPVFQVVSTMPKVLRGLGLS